MARKKVARKSSSAQKKKGKGLKQWFLSHLGALLISGSLLFFLAVTLVALCYTVFFQV